MNEIKVNKDDLLAILRENKAQHRDVFKRAVEAFRSRALDELNNRIREIKKGKVVSLTIALPVPEDHTVDYDRVIRMVELSVDPVLALSETDVACYVQDDWAWRRQWVATTAAYVGQSE